VNHPSPPWQQQPVAAAATPAPAAPDLTPSRPVYDGRLGELYAIYLRHIVLMLLTFGWSRFWGRTRLRRYVWSHLAVLGDRFEYRGRGRELLIGFLLALLMIAAWGGLMWLVWVHVFHEKPIASFGVFDIFSLSVALIGFPLALSATMPACATGCRERAGAASAAGWSARPGDTVRRRRSSPSSMPAPASC
jgi:hypothetical protein